MALRLLAANAEHWLAHHLNANLQDPNEYRAITRHLLQLDGAVTHIPHSITMRIDRPTTPEITLLTDQLNTSPLPAPPATRAPSHIMIKIQQSPRPFRMSETPGCRAVPHYSHCHFPQHVIECNLPITNPIVKRPRSDA